MDILIKEKELLTYFLYMGLFCFIMNRAYGVANLLRFLFRYLNIGYSDRKMKSLDEKWFNIQLFKIINRINVTTIEDARLIQQGLNQGFLKPSTFYFTSGWGDITVRMSLYTKICSFLKGFAIIGLGCFAWYMQEPVVDGYAKFDYKESSYYISKDKMFIANNNGHDAQPVIRSKEDCRDALKLVDGTSILGIACTKFLDERESYQWWLDEEIKSISKAKHNLAVLSYIYMALGVLWVFSLMKFIEAGGKIKEYRALTGD